MSRTSEFEYTVVLHPPAFAHAGDPGSTCSPSFCSSSDSAPALSSFFDSGEPFWTSQTVIRMNSVNWRYSDCQFSVTSTQNADDCTHRHSEMVSSWWATWSWLKSAWPTNDWATSDARNAARKNSVSEFSRT
jgi:hypothetical protein